MKQVEQKRLDQNWAYAKKVWAKEKHALPGWGMRRLHATDKAGMCSYEKKAIYLSTYLLRGHNCDNEKVKKVLMHEIAHALRPGHGHDAKWKAKCKELGGDDRLGVTVVPWGMNWAVSCKYCKWRQEYKTNPGLSGALCGKCHQKIIVNRIH